MSRSRPILGLPTCLVVTTMLLSLRTVEVSGGDLPRVEAQG